MKVIKRDFEVGSRREGINIIPLGDIHYGAVACDEKMLREKIKYIQDNEDVYWIGMGDYCDFINRKDPRFSSASIKPEYVGQPDIVACQINGLYDMIKPIANKCLALLSGNHETAILRHYERDVYSEFITKIKDAGGFQEDYQLGLGYTGWLILSFVRKVNSKSTPKSRITINLHHGFVGGRLAGAKALNMQRWLWTHECDLFMMGHSHNCSVQSEAIHAVDQYGNFVETERLGVYTGTYLRSYNEDISGSSYAEVKGYFPLKPKVPEIYLRPHATSRENRVKVIV